MGGFLVAARCHGKLVCGFLKFFFSLVESFFFCATAAGKGSASHFHRLLCNIILDIERERASRRCATHSTALLITLPSSVLLRSVVFSFSFVNVEKDVNYVCCGSPLFFLFCRLAGTVRADVCLWTRRPTINHHHTAQWRRPLGVWVYLHAHLLLFLFHSFCLLFFLGGGEKGVRRLGDNETWTVQYIGLLK